VLALWHLLSLDAPTVAALWTWAIAHAAGIALSWTAPAATFVAVWMLYAADRLLDARPLSGAEMPPGLEERHRFHHRHRRVFLAVSAPAALALAALLHQMNPAALHLYSLLAALLAAWLLLIHAQPAASAAAHRLPKELAVGIFFPAAVFIPTVARAPQLRLALLPAAAVFACVCTLNCLLLYAWEHPDDRPLAHWTTRWATRHLAALSITVLVAAGVIAIWSHTVASSAAPYVPVHRAVALLACCCVLSVSLLLALDALRGRLKPITLRALADLVLLTPALLLPASRLLAR
jgi:hypothetical protein